MSKQRQRQRRQLEDLFYDQAMRCHWCKNLMVLMPRGSSDKGAPENRATIDHLDDKFNPARGTYVGAMRHVAACWRCNQDRNTERQKELMKTNPRALWERCGAYPLWMCPDAEMETE